MCTLAYVDSLEKAKQFISRISKENKTANHNCWAYILGEKGDLFHCSDAGEPSGTAGKPMLNALQSHCMTNIAAVVTRHFGGVKLGVRGLIDAYAESVTHTLEINTLTKLIQTIEVRIDVSYEFNDILLNQMKNFPTRITHTAYTEKVVHTIEIERDHFAGAEQLLSEYQSQKKLNFQNISKV